MDWRALSVFALIVGLAVGFAIGWHMGSQQTMDAAYQRGIEESRRKLDESKYAAQIAASNARVAEINHQIELEKQRNEELARRETTSPAPIEDQRRYGSPAAASPPPQQTTSTPRPDESLPSWTELERQREIQLRAEKDEQQRAEQRARSEQEARENEIVYIAAGVYHRYGCPYLTEPVVRAKVKDARLAAVPCNYCKPPR